MKKDVRVYIDDMLDAITAIERYVSGMDMADYCERAFCLERPT
jgi:uncharacterized protein with HEPN domain